MIFLDGKVRVTLNAKGENSMRYIEIERINVHALPGSNIDNCIIESMLYSIEHKAKHIIKA